MSISNGVSQEQFRDILGKNLTVCGAMKEDGDVYGGLWSGMNPTDYVFSFFMFQIILSFFISRLLHFLLRPLKQPNFVCDMLTGFILGPSVLGRDKSMLEKPIYFFFITSVKIDKSRIFLTVKKAWNVSLTCLLCMFAFIVFTVLRPLMLWIVKNTPEGKPVKSIYRLILVVLLIIAMLSDAGGTHYLTGAQIVGLIIPAGPPLGSALVEKSELIMSLVDDSYFTAFVLSTVAVNPELSLEACPSFENYLRRLQSMPPIGELRVFCCIHCEDNVNGMITLLKASNPTEISPIYAYTLHLTQISKTSNIPLTIQPLKIIAPYKTMHETICRLATDKFIPLIIVSLPESLEFHGKTVNLRSFNINIQTYAPCTVGILVDKSSHRLLSTTHFAYNVLAIFLGGPNDRHPGVSITMIRIDFKADDDNNKSERYLDECFINKFKSRTIANASAVCHEVVVEETVQVMNVISKVDSSYDLVILGVIGDMVASSDFCGGTMSVLVMQYFGISSTGIESSMTNYDERSCFSFASSNCDRDNDVQALVAYHKRNAALCTQV
ncbi:hypothetical protein ACOSQ3_020581 [Xanthoceras sorbifolium]